MAAAGQLVLSRSLGAPAAAIGDARRTLQIVVNLLSNAVKFTPPGGSVAVSVERAADAVVVDVTDTGPGIPPEMQDAIFQDFVQIGRGRSRPVEGTGLGLALSRRLAALMHGRLELIASSAHGSRFQLRLPAASAASGAQAASSAGEPAPAA
jgi:signal transduction histidine kinase